MSTNSWSITAGSKVPSPLAQWPSMHNTHTTPLYPVAVYLTLVTDDDDAKMLKNAT